MTEKQQWKDEGYAGTPFNVAMPFLNSGHEHEVTNSATGEQRTIQVYSNQTLEEAIETEKQWLETGEDGFDQSERGDLHYDLV